jgi:glutamate synthase (NADPH/NADH) large chain
MLQIPHEFILLQGIPVPEKGKYGTGLVFLPKDEKKQQDILSIMIEEIEREGLQLMHLRNVPTNPDCLGEAALSNEPAIKQVFITGVTDDKVPAFERTLSVNVLRSVSVILISIFVRCLIRTSYIRVC